MVTGNEFLRRRVASFRLLQKCLWRVNVQCRRQSSAEVHVAASYELEGRLEAGHLPLSVDDQVDVEVWAGRQHLLRALSVAVLCNHW